MSLEKTEIDTLVIGAGQAGIAMSEHLTRCGIPHLVLERDRVAERWRSGRWDSLVANGPAWHDRFPGLAFEGVDPDAFPGKERVADYFAEYAAMIDAPPDVATTATPRACGRAMSSTSRRWANAPGNIGCARFRKSPARS